jgi:hypothetical protein
MAYFNDIFMGERFEGSPVFSAYINHLSYLNKGIRISPQSRKERQGLLKNSQHL